MRPVILFQPKLGFFDLFMQDIPLALLALAGSLPQGVPVVIIDQRLSGWKNKLTRALKDDPLCVGFTVKTGDQIHYALEITALVKSLSRAATVWGGVHPSLMPRQTLEHPAIDVVVQGEGERSFPLLVQALANGAVPSGIAGIWHKMNGTITGCNPDETPLDLNILPLLPYHLIDFKDYPLYLPGNLGRNFPLETGRGCLHSCAFCYHSGALRQKRRTLSALSIIERIHHLKQHTPVEAVSLVDDSFLTERDRLFAFAALMREQMNSLKWSCEANASDILSMSDDELTALKASGLTWLAIGAESGSDRILRKVGKNLSVDKLRIVTRRLRDHGFLVRYNFMCGYLWETKEELRQTTDLMMELLRNGPTVSVQSLRTSIPYPGTRYYAAACAAGMREPSGLEEWIDFSIDQCTTPLPWIDERKKRLLTMLYITSFFIDDKPIFSRSLIGSILRITAQIYRRCARYRFEHHNTAIPFELPLHRLFLRSLRNYGME